MDHRPAIRYAAWLAPVTVPAQGPFGLAPVAAAELIRGFDPHGR